MTLTREEGHTEMLVEIVLGFLSKHSVLQRRLGEQVFGSFVGELTSKALGMLLDVLLTPETVAGAGSLFENGDDEMESSEEVEDENDDQGEDEEGDIDEDEEEEEEENEEEDMEMDIDNDADEELDAALSAALGTSKAAINGTSDAGSTSDEDLMNDDEMMALDENLATIFRQRLHQKPTQKKENQEKKEQIVIFKSKVIDLLDILIKHPSPLHLDLILPLLQVLRVTKNDAVHSKTIILLNKLAKNKFIPEATEGLMGLLRKVHEDAAKSRGKDGNIHSQLSIYIARVARKAGIEEEVVGVYAETMRSWIKNGKNNVRAGLFTDWVNWCQSIRR
jgi:DNA polymerase phi